MFPEITNFKNAVKFMNFESELKKIFGEDYETFCERFGIKKDLAKISEFSGKFSKKINILIIYNEENISEIFKDMNYEIQNYSVEDIILIYKYFSGLKEITEEKPKNLLKNISSSLQYGSYENNNKFLQIIDFLKSGNLRDNVGSLTEKLNLPDINKSYSIENENIMINFYDGFYFEAVKNSEKYDYVFIEENIFLKDFRKNDIFYFKDKYSVFTTINNNISKIIDEKIIQPKTNILSVIDNVISILEEEKDNKNDFYGNKIILKNFERIKKNITEELHELRNSMRILVLEDKTISNTLSENIRAAIKKVDKKDIDTFFKKNQIGTSTPLLAIESQFRQSIFLDYNKKFNNIILNITRDFAKQVDGKIKNIFMKNLLPVTSDEKISNYVTKFIYEITQNNAINEKSLLPLLKRFSSGLFEILLNSSFGYKERIDSYNIFKEDIILISYFYGRDEHDESKFNVPFSLILSHEDYNNKLNNNFVSKLINRLGSYSDKEIYDEVVKNIEPPKDIEEIYDNINKDIEILNELIIKGVLKAINMESVLNTLTNDLINAIIESIGNEKYLEFFSEIFKKKNEDEKIDFKVDSDSLKNFISEYREKICS